jgi:hypothetical protein
VVSRFAPAPLPTDAPAPPAQGIPTWRLAGGIGLLTAAVATGVVGAVTAKLAADERQSLDGNKSLTGQQVAQGNDIIQSRNRQAAIEFGCAGAAAVSGVLLLVWPRASMPVEVSASASSAMLSLRGRF